LKDFFKSLERIQPLASASNFEKALSTMRYLLSDKNSFCILLQFARQIILILKLFFLQVLRKSKCTNPKEEKFLIRIGLSLTRK